MTKPSNFIRGLAVGALLAALPGVPSALFGEEITHSISDSGEVWRIDAPTVTQAQTSYPQIVFQTNDGVIVTAGGCVQTGGSGLTWKRYIDPQGPNSDHLYHGLIQLPGIQLGLSRIGIVANTAFTMPTQTPGQNFLHLGYEDDNYPDNGYSNHDDGTGDQCKDVGPAYVVVTILHNVASEEWVSIGPNGIALPNNDVISGQVNALVIHPQDSNTVYVGASEGGVWKTTDGGLSWSPLTDLELVRTLSTGKKKGTLSIGALAIDPNHPQTVYAGTGDPNPACCTSLLGPSLGVFRSADGGGTWAPMGNNLTDPKCDNLTMSTARVNRLLTSAASPITVFAATDAGVFSFREDGADCWKRLGTALPAGRAIDMAADFFHNALYAGIWGKGVYKYNLTAGGAWTLLTVGLPASGFGRIALAFGGRGATPQPQLYAGFDATAAPNTVYRLFMTVDGGSHWSERPSPPADGQLDFNNAIEVGADPNEVYIGQLNLWRATDAGLAGGENDYTVSPPVTSHSWTKLSCCLADSNPLRKGMDLHVAFHRIAFAPAGSFIPDPAQAEIVYVVNDGGITRGLIDTKGVVTWQALTLGLTVGQCGTLALNPNNQFQTLCGLWNNGTAFIDSSLSQSVLVGGGGGFQTAIDAAPPTATIPTTTVYFNCNAGAGGSICRATVSQSPAIEEASAPENIWNTLTGSSVLWSDPYRPGNLLRIDPAAGGLARLTVANTALAADLQSGWLGAGPPALEQTGKITTLAFGIPSLLGMQTPVYYLGTDTGQIWHGSPEAGWPRICECGAPVVAIAPYLSTPQTVYVVFKGTGPGRIKQFVEQPTTGIWTATSIDSAFSPDLQVDSILSAAVDPADATGNTLFVGTDQGLYRGHLSGTTWSWTRALGVPNVAVTDLEVNQGNTATGQIDAVRAATYGRDVFELRRFTVRDLFVTPRPPQEILGLHVQAIQVGENGAPPPLAVKIPVAFLKTAKKAERQKTPFWVAPAQGNEVLLEAPLEIQGEGGTLRFIGWALPGDRSESQPRVALQIEGRMNAVAYYQLSDPDEARREQPERERE